MWSTVWSLVALVGLFISFAGAAILVFKAVKSKEEIIEEAAVRVGVGNFGSQEYKDSLLRKPSAQAALVQSRVAKWGLGIIASGFLLQFSSALALFIFP